MTIAYHHPPKQKRLIGLVLAYPGATMVASALLFWVVVGITLVFIL
jgi:hypothetical protein